MAGTRVNRRLQRRCSPGGMGFSGMPANASVRDDTDQSVRADERPGDIDLPTPAGKTGGAASPAKRAFPACPQHTCLRRSCRFAALSFFSPPAPPAPSLAGSRFPSRKVDQFSRKPEEVFVGTDATPLATPINLVFSAALACPDIHAIRSGSTPQPARGSHCAAQRPGDFLPAHSVHGNRQQRSNRRLAFHPRTGTHGS